MSRRSFWWWAGVALALLLSMPALAHRGHDILSVVEVGNDGRVVVTHRMAAHDLEPVLPSIDARLAPNLDDEGASAAVERYFLDHFSVGVNGQSVSLRLANAQYRGDRVELRYEGRTQGAAVASRVNIASDALALLYPEEGHLVNVRSGGVTHSLLFTAGSAARQEVRLTTPPAGRAGNTTRTKRR